MKQQIERDTARLDELTRRGETLDAEAADHAGRIDGLTAAKSTAAERLDAARDEHRALQQALHEKRARLEDEKNGLTDLLRATSRLHNQITSIDAFEKSLASTRDKLDRRSGDVASQVEALLTARDETAARLAEARQLIDAETAQLAEKRDLAGRFGEQQRALSERLSESREHRAELDARRHLLQEMQDNHEGVADPVKALLARDDVEARGDVALPIRGLVAELFDCDVRHAPLVEAALGDHQQSLVVDRLADLCDAAGSAGWRDALAGRVTFLPLNAPAPRASDTHESAACVVSAKSHRTVLDLVRYPAWLAPLAERLLGRTLIVRDLDAALLLRTTLPTGFRFITEGGEVLDEGGRVTAGPVGAATAGGGLIARRSELASLRARLAELDAIIRSDHDTLTAISDQAAHLERVTAELQQSLFDANAVRVELTGRLENVNVNLAALEKERPVLAAEVEQVHRQLRDADAKRTTHRGEAARLEREAAEREARRAAMQDEIAAESRADRAMEVGAAGVMVAPQRGLNTEAAIRRYFAGVCAALGPDVPVCLQDYPQTTGVHFSVDTILALATDHPQIVMLKHEDWPGLNKLSAVRAGSGAGAVPRLSILVGNGGLFLPEELARGADGAMTGFAYPEMLVEVVRRHAAGDVDGAATLFDAYLPLVRYEQQLGLGLAVRKEILHRRGAIASPRVRAPGPALTSADGAEITRLIERLNTRLEELRRWTSD